MAASLFGSGDGGVGIDRINKGYPVVLEDGIPEALLPALPVLGGGVKVDDAHVEGENLQLDVWDNGPGLPPGQEQTIFDKFARGNKESAVPGVGLGLAICRAIVDVHGGTITAFNRPEGGACFRVTLPQQTAPELEEFHEDM